MPGFATKESHPQKRKFLGFFSPLVGVGPGISPTFPMPRFLLSQLQMEPRHALFKTFSKGLGVRPVLETCQEIIGKAEQKGCAPTVTTYSALKPDIQDVMEIDIGKERGENRALWRTDLCGLNQPVFHDTSLQHPADQPKNTVVSDPLSQKLQQPLVISPRRKTRVCRPRRGDSHAFAGGSDPVYPDTGADSARAGSRSYILRRGTQTAVLAPVWWPVPQSCPRSCSSQAAYLSHCPAAGYTPCAWVEAGSPSV